MALNVNVLKQYKDESMSLVSAFKAHVNAVFKSWTTISRPVWVCEACRLVCVCACVCVCARVYALVQYFYVLCPVSIKMRLFYRTPDVVWLPIVLLLLYIIINKIISLKIVIAYRCMMGGGKPWRPRRYTLGVVKFVSNGREKSLSPCGRALVRTRDCPNKTESNETVRSEIEKIILSETNFLLYSFCVKLETRYVIHFIINHYL